MVKRWPGSDEAASAYVELGDYYFDQSNAYRALVAYRKGLEHGGLGAELEAYARYRLGWTYYNIEVFDQGAEELARVGAAQERGALADAARDDLPRFLLELEPALRAPLVARVCGQDGACLSRLEDRTLRLRRESGRVTPP